MDLKSKKCIPCKGGIPPLTPEQIAEYTPHIAPEWTVVEHHHLQRSFRFKNFVETMGFVNMMAAIAEAEDHHPDFCVSYGRVDVRIWTHAVDGLTESDFILAAKIEALVDK